MTPEDKEEFKILIREVLKENSEEVINPTVEILHCYRDAIIEHDDDAATVQKKLLEAEPIRVERVIKWSDIYSIGYTDTSNKKEVGVGKNLYKLYLNTGENIYALIKDIEKFKEDWQTAMLTYGFI